MGKRVEWPELRNRIKLGLIITFFFTFPSFGNAGIPFFSTTMPQNELCCIILRRLLRRILGMCSAQRDSPGLIGSDCMFPLPGADSADDNAASKSQFKGKGHGSPPILCLNCVC